MFISSVIFKFRITPWYFFPSVQIMDFPVAQILCIFAYFLNLFLNLSSFLKRLVLENGNNQYAF